MDAFISHKRRMQAPPSHNNLTPFTTRTSTPKQSQLREHEEGEEEASTDLKLATLASLYPHVAQEALLDSLIAADGSVEAVCRDYNASDHLRSPRKGSKRGIGFQTSLAGFRKSGSDVVNDGMPEMGSGVSKRPRTLTKKGQTLHLYTPEDIAAHTPCSIIHNFLPAAEAEELLKELLEESPTFPRQTFKLFDNVVQSPHTACFYVDSLEEVARQKTEYLYNGSFLPVRLLSAILPMHCVSYLYPYLDFSSVLFIHSLFSPLAPKCSEYKYPPEISNPFSKKTLSIK